MTKNYLLKPFEFTQEKTLFLFGGVVLLAGSITATLINVRFDGVLDMHSSMAVQWHQPLLDNITNTLCLTVSLYLASLVFNTKTRIIDLVNTALIARIPLYIAALFTMGKTNQETNQFLVENINNPIKIMELPTYNWVLLGISALAALTAMVFMGILLYQGFKTATNVKSTGHKLLLIPAVFVAEILSKLIVYLY